MMRHYSRAARSVALALLALLAVPLSASAQWNAAASMNAARLSVRLVTLADGRVLAVGAAQDPAFAHTAEVYNPATNTWSLTIPGGNALTVGTYNVDATMTRGGTL